ncbi:Hypothetical_protein [Hexamita inflata]|nr:Hypothetical protein HINF_LOCUS60866 [Hexamita inflata]
MDLDKHAEYHRDTALAGFRYVALRSDSVRMQLITELFMMLQQSETLTDSRLNIIFDLYEQLLIYPFKTEFPDQYDADFFKLIQISHPRIDLLREHMQVLPKALSQFNQHRALVPLPAEFNAQVELQIESEAVQFGSFSVCLLIYHQQTNTVMLKRTQDDQIVDYIIPNKPVPFSPELFGRQFKRFLNLYPNIQQYGDNLSGIIEQVSDTIHELHEEEDVTIHYLVPEIFVFNKDKRIFSKKSTVCLFAVSFASEPQMKPLDKFLQSFSGAYADDQSKADTLKQLMFYQINNKQLVGNQFVLTVFKQNMILVEPQTGLPPIVQVNSDQNQQFEALRKYCKREPRFTQGVTVNIGQVKLTQLCCYYEDPEWNDKLQWKDAELVGLVFMRRHQPESYQLMCKLFSKSIICEADDFYDEEEIAPTTDLNKIVKKKRDLNAKIPEQQKFGMEYKYQFYRQSPIKIFQQHHIQSLSDQLTEQEHKILEPLTLTADDITQLYTLLEENNNALLTDTFIDESQIASFIDPVTEQKQKLSIFAQMVRLPPTSADRIADEQLQNDQLRQMLLIEQKRKHDYQNDEVEGHLLDILDRYNQFQDIEPDTENIIGGYTRLEYLYKHVLQYAMHLEVPKTQQQQFKCERILGYKPQMVRKVKQKQACFVEHYSQAIAESSTRFANVINIFKQLGDAIESASVVVFEVPQEFFVPAERTKSTNDLIEEVLRMCE